MEIRRLELLLELSRAGSMREVADLLGTTTSTVSQQIAMLSREAGTALLEREGRNVRLTQAGRRLAAHAGTILAAVQAARLDLDPGAEPAGTLRVSGFVTAIRTSLMPIIIRLAESHPGVQIVVQEHEPAEALALLGAGEVDLALTYDYNLAPAHADARFDSLPLWSTPWSLGVLTDEAKNVHGDALAVFKAFAGHDWIGNSRNQADEDVVRIIASMAGFEPCLRHKSDSLDLVEDLILAGMGIGLLPATRRTQAGVTLLPLTQPGVTLRAYALTRHGSSTWPPLALALGELAREQNRTIHSVDPVQHLK
ncbi:LysR family transcriptional regulator [Micrococcaceae bacterium Sec5.7]